jgi:glycerophosphoryl diester phosphodiesterase
LFSFRRARDRPGSPYLAGSPLLIAHRGGAGLAPENTIHAFRRSIEWWSADILELDVQPTRDGEAAVFHDSTLDRTTDGAGPVIEHSMGEIATLDAGFRYVAEDGATPFRADGVRVSTLDEVLREFPGGRINIEIKHAAAAPRVADTVRELGAEHRVLIAAGRLACRRGLGGLRVAVSASREELAAFHLLHRLRFAGLAMPGVDAFQMPELHRGRRILSPRFIAEAHARNVPVHVWTVDEELDMERLLAWGVDAIITDRPDRLAKVLHRMVGRPLPPGSPG